MAGISDQIQKSVEITTEEELKKEIEQEVVEQPKELKAPVELSKDEITFILSKFAHFDFKGVEIELTYNLIVKLKNTYKQLLNK